MVTRTARDSTLTIRPMHPHIGAEIIGLDLNGAITEDAVAAVRAAFDQHSVLIFRDQDIDDDVQVAFSRRIGELERTSFTVGADNPFVYKLSNVDGQGKVLKVFADKRNFLAVTKRWHTDSSYRPIPAMASILSAREIPRYESADTEFASMRVGYAPLPAARRRQIEGLVAVHDFGYSDRMFGSTGVTQAEYDALPPVKHPMLRIHPGTGEPSLYVSGHIERIVGLPVEQGRALAEELVGWCTRPEYVFRHEWRRHDLVMWDNRCALHRATRIPETEPRLMHRTTVAGSGPVEALTAGA